MILKKQCGVDAGYESSCSILNELKVTEVLFKACTSTSKFLMDINGLIFERFLRWKKGDRATELMCWSKLLWFLKS